MESFFLIVPVLLFSVIVHEVAHAWQALREGDPTARDLGRITLNPIPHLSLVGSVIVPVVLYLLPGQLLFGWAKPVPVNPENFRDCRTGEIRVALAGIVMNILLAVVSALALAIVFRVGGAASTLSGMLNYGILINLILAYVNLLPVPPLDGSHVLYHLLPRALAKHYRAGARYGVTFLFLTMIAFPGAVSVVLAPVFVLYQWILGVVIG